MGEEGRREMCGFEGHGYVLYNTTLLFSRVMEQCSVAGYSNVYSVQLCQQLMCYNSVKEHRNTQQHKQHSTLVEGI